MGYWPVGSKFVGVVGSAEKSESNEKKHHVWIFDRSGSMTWVLDEVVSDMCNHLKNIPSGDVISIGYFSGVGDYRWIVKGTRLVDQRDYDAVVEILKKNSGSRNTTCFSEILMDVPQLIADIAPLADSVELVFLTDGHPVVPSYEREKSAIFKAIKDIKGKIASGLLVGYNEYYNRSLMAEMAQSLGATLQHADEIQQFGKELGKIIVKAGKKRTTITLPAGAEAAFTIENGRVVVYAVDNNSVVAPVGTSVYYITKNAGSGVSQKPDDPYQTSYASALLSLQSGDIQESLNILGEIGDIAIVERLGSAMTNKEFADVESLINEAATDLTKRFLRGQKKGCAPKEDAFDLIDLLNLLQSDGDAKLHLSDDRFKYRRIGRKSDTDPKYPKFVPNPNEATPISGLTGNATELNISVSTTVNGTVELPDEMSGLKREDANLPKVYPVHIWRTYNLIANALPNVTVLPVSVGEKTFETLRAEGVIPASEKWEPEKAYALDLLAVPACNRARGKQSCDWDALAKRAVESVVIGSKLKVIKAKLAELDPNKEGKRQVSMTPEQQAYLQACGVGADGTYSPPSTQQEATDVLKIRTFEVKVAKTSSVSMNDFSAMLKPDGKKMNWVGEMMLAGHDDIQGNMPKTAAAAIAWLNERVKELSREKRLVDSEISASRYAIALGGHWKKYHSGQEATYTVGVNGYKATKEAVVAFVFKDDVEKKI